MRLGSRIGRQALFTEGLAALERHCPELDSLYLEFMDELFQEFNPGRSVH